MSTNFLEAGVKEQAARTIGKNLGVLFVVMLAITGAVVTGTGMGVTEAFNEELTPFPNPAAAFFGAMPAGAFLFGVVGFLLKTLGKRYLGQQS